MKKLTADSILLKIIKEQFKVQNIYMALDTIMLLYFLLDSLIYYSAVVYDARAYFNTFNKYQNLLKLP